MKIVHLCLSSFYIDDYSYQENMLPKYHVKLGMDVSIIASLVSFDSSGKPCLLDSAKSYTSKDGIKVVRLDYKRGLFYKFNKFVRRYNSLKASLKNEKPDILFIHDYSFFDIWLVIKYAKAFNVKVYVDCHTDYINSAKGWVSKNIFHHIVWRYVGRLINPHITKFYGVTPLRCNFLRDAYRIPEDKIELLLMGIDDDLLKDKLSNGVRERLRTTLEVKDEFVILTGGKIDSLKNIDLVLKAFQSIQKKFDNVSLIVFGTISLESKAYIEKLLDYPKIKFVGWLSTDQIMDYFIMSDLIVFPGTHSVLWEQAVGTGTPTLFKYWKGMDHVDVGGNARFLYHDDETEIESELIKILEDKEVYNNMLEAGNRTALRKFAYSEIAKKSINYDFK